MHYSHNLSSASGGSIPGPTPLGNFRPQVLNLPTPGKKFYGRPRP